MATTRTKPPLVVKKTYVLNPENRVHHDPRAYVTKRKCQLCEQEKPLVDFPKVFGAKPSDELEKKYGDKCFNCFRKERLRLNIHRVIDGSKKLDDTQKAELKKKADFLVLVKGYDIFKTRRELGLMNEPIPKTVGKLSDLVIAGIKKGDMKLVQALPKIPTVAPKAGVKKGMDISSEQLAAHVKAMNFIKK